MAVADRRGRTSTPARHGGVEAVVGHHRHGHAVARQAPGSRRWSAARRPARRRPRPRPSVDGQHAIAVAVEGEPDVEVARGDPLGERLDMVEPTPSLMLRPSGSAAMPRRRRRGGGRSPARPGTSHRRGGPAGLLPPERSTRRNAIGALAGSRRPRVQLAGAAVGGWGVGSATWCSMSARSRRRLVPPGPKNSMPLSRWGCARPTRPRGRTRSSARAEPRRASGTRRAARRRRRRRPRPPGTPRGSRPTRACRRRSATCGALGRREGGGGARARRRDQR